jgi:S-adenosyl-L-methionine hydrolase (adenosine-forming)
MCPIITLTTDFGTRDGYVAQMKGVILGINPEATLVDVTHEVPAFDIMAGAMVIAGISEYFPPGTIHVGVVDPGVGSERRPMVVSADGRLFVGPDNGLFTIVSRRTTAVEFREIANHALTLPGPSPTFHGRDRFAPCAARISAGFPLNWVGPPIEDPVFLDIPGPHVQPDRINGHILYVDRFGNLCCDVRASDLRREAVTIAVGSCEIKSVSRTFSEAPVGAPVALINSFGHLEIAINRGNASEILGVGVGAELTVEFMD